MALRTRTPSHLISKAQPVSVGRKRARDRFHRPQRFEVEHASLSHHRPTLNGGESSDNFRRLRRSSITMRAQDSRKASRTPSKLVGSDRYSTRTIGQWTRRDAEKGLEDALRSEDRSQSGTDTPQPDAPAATQDEGRDFARHTSTSNPECGGALDCARCASRLWLIDDLRTRRSAHSGPPAVPRLPSRDWAVPSAAAERRRFVAAVRRGGLCRWRSAPPGWRRDRVWALGTAVGLVALRTMSARLCAEQWHLGDRGARRVVAEIRARVASLSRAAVRSAFGRLW